tara:strand:+ start:702 stop:956 length:255 start_codon:yes stop_codon:yes gene_type:complete
MAVGYIENKDGEKALYCTTTMQAFGPILNEDDDVEDFLEWLPIDARNYSDQDLNNKYYDWKRELEDAEVQLEKDHKNGLYGEQY